MGDYPEHVLTVRLHYLDCHFPEAKIDTALWWLIKNCLTGKRFLSWIESDCAGSNLEMIRQLTAKIEREKQTRKLYTGDMQL